VSAGFDPARAARRLAPLWRSGGRIAALPPEDRPADPAQGYAVQRRLAALLGDPPAGYKLGLSSPAAMARTGLGAPLAGFVPRPRLHPSGTVLDLPAEGAFLIEVEIVLRLDGTASGIEAAHLGLEIVRSRFTDRDAVGLPSFIADAVGFHALVLGDALPLDALPDLLRAGAALRMDGAPAAGAAVGEAAPDPLDALRRFRALAADHGMPVEPGMLVATGNLVAPFETDRPGAFEGRLGAAAVRFASRRPGG